MNFGDGFQKASFYTPRYIDAVDSVLAQATAIEDFLHSDKYFEINSQIINTSDDPPRFSAEDIEECSSDEYFENGQVPGIAFYRERDA